MKKKGVGLRMLVALVCKLDSCCILLDFKLVFDV